METEEQDAPEVLETPEEEIEIDLDTEPEPETDEEKETLRKENEELKAKNKQLFERAKKQPAPKPADLSQTDLYVLMKADVAPDDIADVTEYAKLKGISVEEALKTNVVKTILADKAEERKTSEAANTGRARRAGSAVSDEAILANASKGSLPDDTDRVAQARMDRRKAATKH